MPLILGIVLLIGVVAIGSVLLAILIALFGAIA